MATVQELQVKIDSIPPLLDAIANDTGSLKGQIQALKDQLAAGTPVSQEQLDELDEKAAAIVGRLIDLDTQVP